MKKHENTFETSLTKVAIMAKPEVKKNILSFKGRFSMDFTDEYLEKQSVDRLRHILAAALLISGSKHAS